MSLQRFFATGFWAILALTATVVFADSAPPAITLYVASDGIDTADGSKDKPLATLSAAKQKIRDMKANGPLPKGGVVVEMRGGHYEWSEPLKLTAKDAGTIDSPIVYRACPGEKVNISGGRLVKNWKPVTDPAILERLDPAAKGKVYQIDLKAMGITEYGDLLHDAAWELQAYVAREHSQGENIQGNAKASNAYVKSTGKAVKPRLELFCNGKPMKLSRGPNQGFYYIDKVLGKTLIDVRGVVGCKEGIFTYRGDGPSRWVGETEGFIQGYWFRDWVSQTHRIESIDPEKRIIEIKKPYHDYGGCYRNGQWFYSLNMLCELDRPGEWYLNHQTGMLYFWPPGPIENATIEVSAATGLFKLTDTANLTIQGLTMESVRGVTAVEMKNCQNCRVVGCTLRNMSNHAVTIFKGTNCGVIGCDISEMGGGGIYLIGGDSETLTPGGHFAENNHIHHFGRWDRTYRPAIWLSGVGLRASHNLIHHAPHAAILYGGQEHLLEYNEIHNVCQESHDCGAIYAGRGWQLRGVVMQHNYLHHLCGKDGGPCNGIYLDDGNSGVAVRGNVFHQVQRPVFVGGGRDNYVENNIFIDCPQAFHLDARYAPGNWAEKYGVGRIKQAEEKGTVGKIRFAEPPYSTKYPKLANMFDEQPLFPKGNVLRTNLFYRGDGTNLRRLNWENPPKSKSWRQEQWWHHIQAVVFDLVTIENNLVDIDPKFVDEKVGNFQLREDSPAWEIGFKKIPFEKIGLYHTPNRASWPVAHEVTPLPPRQKH